MNERRRPSRRGRGKRPSNKPSEEVGDNPYREDLEGGPPSRSEDSSSSGGGEREGPSETRAAVEADFTPPPERYTAPVEAPPAPEPVSGGSGGGEQRPGNGGGTPGDTGEFPRPDSGTGGRPSGPVQMQQGGGGGGGQYQGQRDRQDRGDGGFH